MRRISGPIALLLAGPILALATRAGSAAIVESTQLRSGAGQGPFPTLPPLSVTITPAIISVEIPAASGFQTMGFLSPVQMLGLLTGPRVLLASTIMLPILAVAGFRFFRKWHLASLPALRTCNVPKLIAGFVIAIMGVVIGLLGIVLLLVGAAEGPLGLHTLAVGGLMVLVGAIFVYLGAKVVVDSGCFVSTGS